MTIVKESFTSKLGQVINVGDSVGYVTKGWCHNIKMNLGVYLGTTNGHPTIKILNPNKDWYRKTPPKTQTTLRNDIIFKVTNAMEPLKLTITAPTAPAKLIDSKSVVQQLRESVKEIRFTSVKGDVKTAKATLNFDLIPPSGWPKDKSGVNNSPDHNNNIHYWDVDKGGWRCFKADKLIEIQ